MRITPAVSRRLLAVLDARSNSFVELAGIAGLDPRRDFRGADLRGVDFGRDDLSGFDFSGADLRDTRTDDARGIPDAKIDPKTKLPPGWLPPIELLSDLSSPFSPAHRDIAGLIERFFAGIGAPGRARLLYAAHDWLRYTVVHQEGRRWDMESVAKRVRDAVPDGAVSVDWQEIRLGFNVRQLRDTLSSDQFKRARAPLTLVIGETTRRAPRLINLNSSRHLIVACPLSGCRSSLVHAAILSLLYRHPPKRCQLVLIDPTKDTLFPYEGAPNLAGPIRLSQGQVQNVLESEAALIEKRRALLSDPAIDVSSISEFGKRQLSTRQLRLAMEAGACPEIAGPNEPEGASLRAALPYRVIVVDHFDTLLEHATMSMRKNIRTILREGSKVGVHLVAFCSRLIREEISSFDYPIFSQARCLNFIETEKESHSGSWPSIRHQQIFEPNHFLVADFGPSSKENGLVQCPFVTEQDVRNVVGFLKRQAPR